MTSRLVTASNALLRLARTPGLAQRVDAAVLALDGVDLNGNWQDNDRRRRAVLDVHDDQLIRLANVLSTLAVPDEAP